MRILGCALPGELSLIASSCCETADQLAVQERHLSHFGYLSVGKFSRQEKRVSKYLIAWNANRSTVI